MRRAERKARQTEQPAGAIPLRVAVGVLEAAIVAEDELVAEYLSGVLASARTPGGTDDSAVSWTALIQRLSASQLRLHYGLCVIFRQVFEGEDTDDMSRLLSKQIAVPGDVMASYMGDQWNRITTIDGLYGLRAESLIGDRLVHGETDYVRNVLGPGYALPGGHDEWWIFTLTQRSLALFLHAFGYSNLWIAAAVDEHPDRDFALPVDGLNVGVLKGYRIDALLSRAEEAPTR